MADNKTATANVKTWQDKLSNSEPLNHLDEVKADADFNYQQRLREEKARKEFEDLKAGRGAKPDASAESTDEGDTDNTNSNDGKKGK